MRQIEFINYPVIGEDGVSEGKLDLNTDSWTIAHFQLQTLAIFLKTWAWVRMPQWLSGGYFVNTTGDRIMRII